MSHDNKQNPEISDHDAEKLMRIMELELIQKRAQLQRTAANGRSLRTFSYAFVFLLVIATVVGFFLVFTGVTSSPSRQSMSEAGIPSQP